MDAVKTHDLSYEVGREPVWGFVGTGADPFVGKGGGKLFFVDPAHTNASDGNDGTDPTEPFATLQGLIDRTAALAAGTATRSPALEEHDTVYILSDLTESVITGSTVTMPNHVNIIGAGSDEWSPAWTSGAVDEPCLTLRALGWVVQGLKFLPGSAAAGIKLELVAASSYNASRATIKNCEFDGAYTGFYGIEFFGAPYDVKIKGCEFRELTAAGNAYAIIITNTSFAHPYMCKIIDNIFWENENHIGSFDQLRSFNASIIKGNIFYEGEGIESTLLLDMRGGASGNCIITGNTFCGDYSQAGGYYPNATKPGNWVGNFAEDVAENEVGDNGLTIAPPAA